MKTRHFPLKIQHDSMQCGVACLQMICSYYGMEYSLDHLSEICTPTREGVSFKGISDAAKTLGLETCCCKMSIDNLCDITKPCILHWNQNHFVVLYCIHKKRRFQIADPAKGLITCSIEDLDKSWATDEDKGFTMTVRPTDSFGKSSIASQKANRSFKFLWGYMLQYRRHFFKIILWLLIGSGLQLVMPFLTQAIVDSGIKNRDIGFIWLILLGELFIVTGRTVADFIRRWLLLNISVKVNISLVSDFFIKLLKLPMSYFDTKLTGDLLQRMSDHGRVQTFLTTQALSMVFTLLTFLVFGIVLFIYDHLIFGVFLIGSIIYGLWIASFLHRRKIIDYQLFEKQAVNQNKTYRFITSMQEIKLQDCERRRREEWESSRTDLFDVETKSLKLKQTQEAGSIFINELKNILITVVSATAVINGQISLGAMLSIQYIVGQLNSPVEQLMSFIYSIQDVKISLERINEIHTRDNEESDTDKLTTIKDNSRTISFDKVTFRYNRHSSKKTIDNISFEIPEGKVTAIVGASGSGKTTLIKLMLGYYKLESGKISVGANNLDKYSLKWWRRQCGVVMQDGVIFSESIARNIAVDDRKIDEAKMEIAARIANIHDYISSLPLKYGTIIGDDGVGLSQGQRQRILIARAVYKDPDFIFLDEATNALDAKNERVIVENLREFYKGRTVVIVAHRLSTVKNADQIIVVDDGRIAERGSHSSLIEKHGSYYNLIRNQLELGK